MKTAEDKPRRALWFCGTAAILIAPLLVLFQISRFSVIFPSSMNGTMFYDAFRTCRIINISTENALIEGVWKPFAKLYLQYAMEDHLYLYTVLEETAKYHPDPYLFIFLGGLAEQHGAGAPAPWFRRALADGSRLTPEEQAFCRARLAAHGNSAGAGK